MEYDWNFKVFAPYASMFLQGAWVTIEMSAIAGCLGTLLGFLLGGMFYLVPGKRIVLLLNDVVRAVPLIVLIFIFFYFPYVQVLGIVAPSPFFCATLALTVSQAAFTADLVFGATSRVNPKTVRGGQSLGLSKQAILLHVIIPDIFRQTLPALVAFWIGIIKWSSVASLIGCRDVAYVANVASTQNYRSLEGWTIVALVYVALVLPLTLYSRKLESLEWLQRR
jgi:His/Glu/Gln/Arg/opine family amino acid ABC transporter permease subunit